MRKFIAFCLAALLATGASASQGTGCLPTTGTITGLSFVQALNAAMAAVISSNSGSTAPATDCTGVPVKGQHWLDTSTTPHLLKIYDGTNWLVKGAMDTSGHNWLPPIGGGVANIASGSTADLGSVSQTYLTVTGTTTITSFGSSAGVGVAKFLKFAGAVTVTHNATSLIIPGGANFTSAAGDQAVAVHLGSGNWTIASYTKATGEPLVNPAVPVGSVIPFAGFTAPANYAFPAGQCYVRNDYPALTAALSLAQSGIRVSGNATLTGISDTSQLGAGMVIEGTGIPPNTTIVSVTSTTIVMSATATTSGTSTVTAFPYGTCSDATKVGVPDLRGRAVAGRDGMGGTLAGRLNATGGLAGVHLGATGGAQTVTLSIAQLPVITPTGTVTPLGSISGSVSLSQNAHSHGSTASSTAVGVSNSTQNVSVPAYSNNNTASATADISASFSGSFTGSSSTLSITPFGSGSAHAVVQPTMSSNLIMRIQ